MKVSIPLDRIKLLLALAAVAACGGCGGGLAEAPFAARPGSVVRGDVRGPFDGQVLDADTGKPVAGAIVLVTWAWQTSGGVAGPVASHVVRTLTDADGRYELSSVNTGDEPGYLARATLLIYKRGYVGWRSDRRWDDFAPRGDFSQANATVRLERFPLDGSHVRLLRYLGAGGPLAGDLAGELQLAADELAQSEHKEVVAEPLLDATILLAPEELKVATSYVGKFTLGKLGDLPTTPGYDSVHFRAVDQPESFDAALRLFVKRDDPAAAREQYDAIRKEYPAVDERNEVGDHSLRAAEDDLLAVAAVDEKRGIVVVFTCGKSLCKDHDIAAGILRRMWPRLDRIVTPVDDKPQREHFKLRRPELP